MNAQIVHCTPGRLRIKIPAARHNIAFFSDLQQKLLSAEGISSVTINPTAASLVIVHDGDVDPRAVCRSLPGLAVTSFAMCPHTKAIARGDSERGNDTDLVFLLAKLLPLIFAGHPIARLAEIVGEPILRAVVEDMMRPRSYRLPVTAKEEEELVAIAA
ncbi:hypothetical protein IE4872_CH03249 [Rhizobium gallicum]|uniref:Uncharacterized protein n=1 Tax=Rhizobium gallicum TaxID=56730 RepID=A0A1L5NM04_9HYPH|nr:hypothetical protein [Rhizobium gallicum]APO68849.1 hypothetical protein IE4872_CH03249 [Rhizobium gallicum]